MSKIYGFDEHKNKYEVYEKGKFAILKSEYIFKTDTAETGNSEYVTHYLFFPDKTWDVNNTRVLEARTTYYNKIKGNFMRNMSKLVGDSQIQTRNQNVSVSALDVSVTITPEGYSGLGVPADIYYCHETWGEPGAKEVFEVLLLKIDMEET